MSKLLNTYNNLKKQNSDIIYLFKNGAFYLALQEDAQLLSKEFNLKITNLNSTSIKCGFPCTSFDKYFFKLKSLNKEFKIIDKDIISDSAVYLENKKVQDLINEITNIDINNLSVSEAFAFIEKLQLYVNEIQN